MPSLCIYVSIFLNEPKETNSGRHTDGACSCDAEGAGCLLDALPGALEPPLVAGLRLADVELAVRDGGRDELVLAALVAVGRPGQHGHAVVLLPVHHRRRALEDVGRGHRVGLEPALHAQAPRVIK